MEYLSQQELYASGEATLPAMILLDLNMPRKSGRQALKEIKANARWQSIPVIVLTTSSSADDIQDCYASGANGYVRKPASFEQLVEALKVIEEYWFKVSVLPDR